MYAPFDSVPKEERHQLLVDLSCDLRSAAVSNDGIRRFLEALSYTIEKAEAKCGLKAVVEVKHEDGKIELKFDVSYNDELDIYAWSFNGFNDFAMIKYAKKYNFPRGCIVLWKKRRSIDLRGFYPKVHIRNTDLQCDVHI
jgi:hypothetical protein